VRILGKILVWAFGTIVVAGAAIYVALRVSPWPAALVYRYIYGQTATSMSRVLAAHVPSGVSSLLNQHYDPADPDAYLDIYYPAQLRDSGKPRLTIVWIHGGGFLAGDKSQIANYAKILAAKDYTVVGVDYTIAPEAMYPTPPRQVNAALAFLSENAAHLHIDETHFVLAGDSAGANIAAQIANAISVPSYAQSLGIVPSIARSDLRAVVLYCGVYNVRSLNLKGTFGNFVRTALWSYSGTGNFEQEPRLATFSVINYVTPNFPPAFISAGNNDPLALQSTQLAQKLQRLGVRVDALFFPENYVPPVGHDYQFDLDADAGRVALERSLLFLANLPAART
jgi:acetyl esterase